MDFFSSQDSQHPAPEADESTDPFAQAIRQRFSGVPNLLPLPTPRFEVPSTSGFLPHLPSQYKPSSSVSSPMSKLRLHSPMLPPPPPAPMVRRPTSNINSTRYTPISSESLVEALQSNPLILDIRPHAAYTTSRIPTSISLSVPSTLLKRPMFNLEKLATMLAPTSARERFNNWNKASRIIVYDADSTSISEGSNLLGTLRKFEQAGFTRELGWICGGFAAVRRTVPSLVDESETGTDSNDEDNDSGLLRARNLPQAAFYQSSTTSAGQRVSPHEHVGAGAAPVDEKRHLAANPFYDNIRQNMELSLGITERIPLKLPASVIARKNELPFPWLRKIVERADREDGAESLAMQFYRIELGEQRRLMGVMDHHSKESQTADHHEEDDFPYSIIAGVEKGSKNRYRNIWPFEHARVRLQSKNTDDGSDYVNASYVEPLGTDRRYIATQGPLPSTYNDFWTLCWEQDVRVIVMLTRQLEGNTIKCGSYWTDNAYGNLRLQMISEKGGSDQSERLISGFDFSMPVPPVRRDSPSQSIIRRTFRLSRADRPSEPARTIVQLQYLDWPDLNVPDSPQGVLHLIKEVDEAVEKSEGTGPVLLHCSAGVGRTGGFIVIDAVLDGVRREMRKKRKAKEAEFLGRSDGSPGTTDSPPSMDVDSRSSGSPPNEISQSQSLDGSQPPPLSATTGHRQKKHSFGSSSSPSKPASRSSAEVGHTGSLRKTSLSKTVGLYHGSTSKSQGSSSKSTNESSSSLPPSSKLSPSSSSLPNTSNFSSFTQSKTNQTTEASSPERSRSPSPPSPMKPHSTFDFTAPRELRRGAPKRKGQASPEPLSTYDEPIRHVLEDMREQRMSLCQSLRQYVFVHRAIIEGVLDIVDEERSEEVRTALATAAASETTGKRRASPTELVKEDKLGEPALLKRPSMKKHSPPATGDSPMEGLTLVEER